MQCSALRLSRHARFAAWSAAYSAGAASERSRAVRYALRDERASDVDGSLSCRIRHHSVSVTGFIHYSRHTAR